MQPRAGVRHVVFSLLNVAGCALLLIGISGDWRWPEGWIFGAWLLAVSLATTLYLYRHDPELLLERFRMPGKQSGQKPWDTLYVAGITAAFLAWLVLMPLDARRYHWSSAFPLWLKLAGVLLLLVAFVFLHRSFVDNTFLSPLVRVQSERRQRVITTGVYGLVRHPMYLGASCMFAGGPLLLGSISGIFAGLAVVFLLAGRIIGEERMLRRELDGYAEYQTKVRYRLMPWVW
jgi:protein-S-isoprenylcysteine O-methyltransferase Ste14